MLVNTPHAFAHMSYQLRTRESIAYAGMGKRPYSQWVCGLHAMSGSIVWVTASNHLVPACGDSRPFRVYAFMYASRRRFFPAIYFLVDITESCTSLDNQLLRYR